MSDIFIVNDEKSYNRAAQFAVENVSTFSGLGKPYGHIPYSSQLMWNSRFGVEVCQYNDFVQWYCSNCEHQCALDEPLYLCLRVLGTDPKKGSDRNENYSFELACAQCSQSSPLPTRKDLYDKIDMYDFFPITYQMMADGDQIELYVNRLRSINIK